ncbi:MAG: hypothetical protein HY717_06510 [Planctomycetes bacterium]|nr:hypothetical protein [Planctomycetota bacterium]
MDKTTRRAVQDILEGLKFELVRLMRGRLGQGNGPKTGPAVAAGTPAPPPPRRAGLHAALQDLEQRFQLAEGEWNSLLQAIEQVRSEMAGQTFDEIFGLAPAPASGSEESSRPSGVPPPGPPAPAASFAAAAQAPEKPASEPEGPALESQKNLENKLDELLGLVRLQLAEKPRSQGELDSFPEGWTYRIAKEVVNRLKDNLALTPPAAAASADSRPAPPKSNTEPIALDDVASMIDALNRRKR